MGRENHLMDVVGATKIILCIPLDLLFSSRNQWHNSRRRWFQATNRPRPAVAGIFDSPSLVLPHWTLKELYGERGFEPQSQGISLAKRNPSPTKLYQGEKGDLVTLNNRRVEGGFGISVLKL